MNEVMDIMATIANKHENYAEYMQRVQAQYIEHGWKQAIEEAQATAQKAEEAAQRAEEAAQRAREAKEEERRAKEEALARVEELQQQLAALRDPKHQDQKPGSSS